MSSLPKNSFLREYRPVPVDPVITIERFEALDQNRWFLCPPASLEICLVRLKEDEIDLSVRAAEHFYSSRKGTSFYQTGAANDPTDPYKIERICRYGEIAFAKIFRVAIDLSFRAGGDRGIDATLQTIIPVTVDVKTAVRKNFINQVLAAHSPSSQPLKLGAQLYVFSYLVTEEDGVVVALVGGEWRENVMLRRMQPSKLSESMEIQNYVLRYSDMIPIGELYREYNEYLKSGDSVPIEQWRSYPHNGRGSWNFR